MKISIYTTDGMKVYEEWLEQIAPGSYSFVWDGSMNVVPPPPTPDGLAPAGLYVFDIEVIGIAPGYDEDWLRSRALRVGEHEVYVLAYEDDVQSSYAVPSIGPVQVWYLLRGYSQAAQVIIEVYDPDFERSTLVSGTTKTIPEEASPQPNDWNLVDFSVSLAKAASFYPFTFVFWAWDGNRWYKNHQFKTTFNNLPLLKYTSAHFMGRFFLRLNSHKKAAQELRDVRYYWYNPWAGKRFQYRVDYGEEWWWTDPANTVPPTSPTNIPSLHRERSALQWDEQLVFRALECTSVVTLFGHGNRRAMGPTPRRATLTAQDLINRYTVWWGRWSVRMRRWVEARGLRHLRLVLLLGCNTGGNLVDGSPEPGSLADTFKNLGVQCVIFMAASEESSGRGIASVTDRWVSRFWEIATKNCVSVANAVIIAKSDILSRGDISEFERKAIKAINVIGDTWLAL